MSAKADIRVQGLEPWRRDVIVDAMIRGGISGDGSLTFFLSGLPDEDLQSLHGRFGGLLSEEANEVLTELAEAVRRAGFRKKSLAQIAQLARADDPCDLRALTDAVMARLAG